MAEAEAVLKAMDANSKFGYCYIDPQLSFEVTIHTRAYSSDKAHSRLLPERRDKNARIRQSLAVFRVIVRSFYHLI